MSGPVNLTMPPANAPSRGSLPRVQDRRGRAGAVGLAALIGVSIPAGGQAGEPQPVTLAEAIARAEARHPDLPIREARVAAAESGVARARAGRYPRGEARAIFGIVNGARVGEVPDGLPNELAPLFSPDNANDLLNDLGPFVQSMIRIDQVIYTFGKIGRGVEAAQAGVEAERAELERKTDEVRLEVKKIYYGYQIAARLADFLGEVEKNFEEALEQARARMGEEGGEVTQSDVLKLEIAKNGFTTRRLELERQRAVSLAAFRRAIGAGLDSTVVPAEDRIRPVELRGLGTLEELRAEASEAPALVAAERGLEARERAVAAARARLWPDFFAGVLVEGNWAPRRDNVPNPYLVNQFNLLRGGPFLGLRWDLDFAMKLAAIQAAEAEAEEQRAQRDRALSGVPLAIETAFRKLEEKQEGLRVAQRSRKAGRGLSFLTAANFRMGIGDAREILEAYGLYARSTSEYYRAVFELNMAAAELSKALGHPVEAELAE